MRRGYIIIAVLAAAAFALASVAVADVPQKINYQGWLTDSLGDPVPDDSYSMVFTIYDSKSGGTAKWTETQSNVDVKNGSFDVLLGSVIPVSDTVFNDTARYLGISIEGDDEIQPRTRITSVAYAMKSLIADTAKVVLGGGIGGNGTTNYLPKFTGATTVGNSALYEHSNGRLAKGLTNPMAELHIHHDESGIRLTNDLTESDWDDGFHLGWRTEGSKQAIVWNWEDGSIGFGTNGQDRMYIADNGFVGIGTDSPTVKLEVNGMIYSTLNGFKFPDGTIQTTAGNGWTDAGSVVSLADENDSVGIGTAIPNTKLEVRGYGEAIRASGSFFDDPAMHWIQMRYDSVFGPILEGSDTLYPPHYLPRLTLDAKRGPDRELGLIILGLDEDVVDIGGGLLVGGDIETDGNIHSNSSIQAEDSMVCNGRIILQDSILSPQGVICIGREGGPVDFPMVEVGIGTANPAYTLDVYGIVQMLGFRIAGGTSGQVLTSDDNGFGYWQNPGAATDGDWTISGNDIYSSVTGNVGIGETNPTSKLDVDGEAKFDGALYARDETGIGLKDKDSTLGLWVEDGGDVGIGLSDPADMLDVDGDIRVRGMDIKDSTGTERISFGDAWGHKLYLRDEAGNKVLCVDTTRNVGIGTQDPKGALDVNSTTGALIVPRMTTVQRDALTALNGMIIYNTTSNQFNFYENGAWVTK
jgi:hypothetical protein